MKRIIAIYILAATAMNVAAQFSAGPDKIICSGTGTNLGVPTQTVPESWCITWSPADYLDDPHSIAPHANPPHTLTYTVTVLTDEWQGIITDDVKVTVGFGGIKFTPPFLYQGSDEVVHSEVTINPENHPVTWSIEGDALGCTINPSTGDLTAGQDFGQITVRATNNDHPTCYADATIEINEGVRDLTATDGTHSGRVAKEGRDTLYLIGESSYIVKAIPNAGGFAPGTPIWYNDGTPHAIVPADGETTITGGVSSEDGHHYTAGSEEAGHQPKVIISHINSNEFQVDMTPVINEITTKFSNLNKKLKEKLEKSNVPIPNFSVEVNLAQLKYKTARAEKYNDPGWDYKKTLEAGGQIALSGKVFHPVFTKLFDFSVIGIIAGTELYLEPYVEFSLVGSVVKDPSKSDPTWTFINPVKANATGGIRGVFNVVGTGAGYSLEGGFSLNAEIGGDLTFNPSNAELRLKFTVAPLQGITKVTIERYVDPKKKWTFFNYTVDLLDKWTSPDFLVWDFDDF